MEASETNLSKDHHALRILAPFVTLYNVKKLKRLHLIFLQIDFYPRQESSLLQLFYLSANYRSKRFSK